MSFLTDLMENIRDAAEEVLNPTPGTVSVLSEEQTAEQAEESAATEEPEPPHVSIVFGSDPPINGICMIHGGGFPSEEHLDTNMMYRLPVVLNGKNESQKAILESLTAIHEALTKTFNYSGLNTENVQVINIATTATPNIIGREQNKQWICGSSFEVAFYLRG